MANKSVGGSAKARRDQYKSSKRMESNRKIKLERQIKLQPNNEKLVIALKDVGYRRKTPKVPFWSHSMIKTAKLFKLFGGAFDPKMLSPDPKLSQSALSVQSPKAKVAVDFKLTKQDNLFFALGTRMNKGSR